MNYGQALTVLSAREDTKNWTVLLSLAVYIALTIAMARIYIRNLEPDGAYDFRVCVCAEENR